MLAARFAVTTVLAFAANQTWAADDAEVNPYRPSVSNPAQLPVPGQLELEFGGLHVKAGEARDDSVPYLFKLAFTKEWGVLAGGDAYVWSRDEQGAREDGIGNTSITLKRAFLTSGATAFGLELGANLPTAKDAIGSGKADYTLNAIYSQDFGRMHLDVNLNTTRIGARDPGTSRMQTGMAAAFQVPLSEDWSGTAELSGVRRGGTPSESQILAAVVYSPNKRFAIDLGVAKGLNRSSQDWSVFGGFVVPIAWLR